MTRRQWLPGVAWLVCVVLGGLGCGGGGSTPPPMPQPPPPPAAAPPSITTSSLPDALEGTAYNFQLETTGGTGALQWSLASGTLPPGFSLSATGQLSGSAATGETRSFDFRVQVRDSAVPPRLDTRDLRLGVVGVLRFRSTSLPRIRVGAPVVLPFSVSGGDGVVSHSVMSGTLPDGMELSGDGGLNLRGTPRSAETAAFTLLLENEHPTFPQTAQADFTLEVMTSPGRNDSPATATVITSGVYLATISPFADPPEVANPDVDYYRLVAPAGRIVRILVIARTPFIDEAPGVAGSLMDPVLEIADAAAVRFQTCRMAAILGEMFPEPLTGPCLNDDTFFLDPFFGVLFPTLDSGLDFLVPGAAGELVTFYLRVFDWAGEARPELRYALFVSSEADR